jgi:hypothetical protein
VPPPPAGRICARKRKQGGGAASAHPGGVGVAHKVADHVDGRAHVNKLHKRLPRPRDVERGRVLWGRQQLRRYMARGVLTMTSALINACPGHAAAATREGAHPLLP